MPEAHDDVSRDQFSPRTAAAHPMRAAGRRARSARSACHAWTATREVNDIPGRRIHPSSAMDRDGDAGEETTTRQFHELQDAQMQAMLLQEQIRKKKRLMEQLEQKEEGEEERQRKRVALDETTAQETPAWKDHRLNTHVRAPFNEMAFQQNPATQYRRVQTFSSSSHITRIATQVHAPFNEMARQQNFVWEGPRFPSFPSFSPNRTAVVTAAKVEQPHTCLKTIRLLRALVSASHEKHSGGTLKYTLEEFPYATCPKYIALSYVWGPETPTSTIHVNGESVSVRTNLKQALSSIQTSNPDAYVWADAICINQRDDKEKSSLVQHMGEIFANAALVYAWLGPIEKNTETSSTEDLFAHFLRLGQIFWDRAGEEGPRRLNERRLDLEMILAKNLDVLFDLFARGSDRFPVEEYAAFSARGFWSRIWVLQEVYLAKNLFYVCGHCRLPSQVVAGALILLESFQRHLMHSQRPFRAEIERNEQLAKFAFGFPSLPEMHRLIIYTSIYPLDVVSLRIAMTNFCVKELPTGSKASDARDMIYGLMGFANPVEKGYIQADYTKSVQETYMLTTRRMIENGFTDILAWAQPATKKIEGLPTWVPDFSATIYESLCSQGQAKPWLPVFNACGESDFHDEVPPFVDGNTLPVRGRRLGVVGRVGRVWVPRARTGAVSARDILLARSAPHGELLAFLGEVRELVHFAGRILRHEGVSRDTGDLVWRVPCADQIVLDGRLVRGDPSTKSRYEATMHGLQECIRSPGESEIGVHARPYVEALLRWVDKRCFVTKRGLVGLGPGGMRDGDEVVVLDGFNGCFVLRERGDEGQWEVVGEAYVDGVMDGEMSGEGEGREWFLLV